MTDRELQRLMGQLGDEPMPRTPAVDDAKIIDAMVRAATPPARPRRWGVLAVAATLVLAGSGLLGARALARPPHASVAHVHEQSGEVMIIAAEGAGASVDAGGRAVAAGDRVVTMGDGQAIVAMTGATASVGPRAELLMASAAEPVVMRAGSARFDVSKRDDAHPFRVRAHDIDITVYGTSFSVAVDGPQVRVTVFQGVVGVRARDATEVRLTAGQTWPEDAATPAIDDAGASAAPRERSLEATPPSATAPSTAQGRHDAPAAPKPPPTSAGPTSLGDQNELLAKAADARRKGDTAGEKRALDAFVEKFSDGPGLHDALAAKMRASARSGDAESAAREARRYVARFPDGPLRDEALSLIARATKR